VSQRRDLAANQHGKTHGIMEFPWDKPIHKTVDVA
jgi:hypothetical protein